MLYLVYSVYTSYAGAAEILLHILQRSQWTLEIISFVVLVRS